MLRSITISSIAALPFLFFQPALAPTCPNILPHEPLVLFDVSGFTLAGPMDIQLTVYNDGTARVCQAQSVGGAVDARVAFVPPAAASQFARDLSILGAGVLCDSDNMFSDTPTSTLTILRDATDSRAHTFSWIGGTAAHSAVEQRVFDFIHAHFPGF
ncbi:MAG: hypothetical protein SGI72_16235 [Planctomycetota bacterium]|nr:hypothetical protein [Planctomycetota bacterium]